MDGQIEITYTSNRVAETIQIGRSTLNKYSRSLEDKGYQFYKDDRGNRAYTEHDIVTLRALKELLDKDFGYDDAITAIATKYRRTLKDGSEIAIPTTQHEDRYTEELQALRREMQLALKQMSIALPPDSMEMRQQRITDMITLKRVESKLEEEALDLWMQKPHSERFIKTGLFSKAEDITKRDRFIKSYVKDHLEQRLNQAYGME